MNVEPYISAIKNSIYSIYFRGQLCNSRFDVEVVARNYINFENGLRDILNSSIDYQLIEFNDVEIFEWLYVKVQSDLSENYEISDFLNYQFERCEKKDYFLLLTKNLFFQYFFRWKGHGGVMEMKLDKFKFIMSWFENSERELRKSSFYQSKRIDFERLGLTEKASINEITTYFEELKERGKITSSIENIKRVLISVFEDSNGAPLKKSTLDTYFNKSKKISTRSKR